MPLPAPPSERRRNTRLAIACAATAEHNYQIAARAGLSPNILAGVISGRFEASPAQRERLSQILGVPVEELFA